MARNPDVVPFEASSGASGSAAAAPAAAPAAVAAAPAADATALVFGANGEGVAAGRLQRALAEAFPKAFEALAAQLRGAEPGHTAVAAAPDVYLVAVVVFPRPSHEELLAREAFRKALEAVAGLVPSGGVLRVVTHCLGGFTGHPEPQLFPKSMLAGLGDWLEEQEKRRSPMAFSMIFMGLYAFVISKRWK